LLSLLLLVLGIAQAASLEEILSSELDRAMTVFSEQEEKPHYAAVVVEDREQGTLSARDGALSANRLERERLLDVFPSPDELWARLAQSHAAVPNRASGVSRR